MNTVLSKLILYQSGCTRTHFLENHYVSRLSSRNEFCNSHKIWLNPIEWQMLALHKPHVYVCFNGINYQSCLARTINLSNSSWLQFPTSFSNTVKKYFLGILASSIYLLGQLPMLPLMDDIATRWEGLSHCLAHYTIHFWQIVNGNSKFSPVSGVSRF